MSRRRNITRRGLFRAGVATGGGAVAVGLLSGCFHTQEETASEPMIVDESAATYVIDPESNESNFSSVDLALAEGAKYTLATGVVLRPSEGNWIAATSVGPTAHPIVIGSVLSVASGELKSVVTQTNSTDPNVAIFDVRCSDAVYAWVEMNLLDRSWTLYASALSEGELEGSVSKLWDADGDWDPPRFVVSGNKVIWQVMPALSGSKTSESSVCYLWRLGSSDAQPVVESPGRFATRPAVSGGTVTLTPRVRASEGVYYGITAYSLSSDLQTVEAQLVLPQSVSPMNAVRIGSRFVFSIEASYGSGGLLGGMGTYIATDDGKFVVLSREPAAEVAGQGSVFIVKSRSSYFVIDVDKEEYAILSAADRSVDYGDFPAREGECNTFVTFATAKDPNTGYPTAVIVRSFPLT
jgi:hypothetical protein